MRTILLLTSLLLAISACEDEKVAASENMPNNEQISIAAKASNQTESEVLTFFEKCVAEGGKGILGGFGQPTCEKPTADAGKSCTQNSDCESLCLAETKTCSPKSPQFGCFEVLENPNQPVTICID